MKTIIYKGLVGIAVASVLVGCAPKSVSSNALSSGVNLHGKTVYIQGHSARYASNSRIANNIKKECKITTQLITFIQESAQKNGVNVKVVNHIPAGALALNVEITDAISQGNAFIGHNKFTAISGRLKKSGKSIGSFLAARRSGGGFFGGYKSSCSVLGRTVKALGQDVGKWIVHPTKGDELGDVDLIIR